jgi:hypothetical protein
MVEPFRAPVTRQYEAALSMLEAGVDRWPDILWDSPGEHDEEAFCRQPCHRRDQSLFGDYEALGDQFQGPARRYDNASIVACLGSCQHPAGQLSLRPRREAGVAIRWVGSGWRDAGAGHPA